MLTQLFHDKITLMRFPRKLIAISALLATLHVTAEDWPQFRGPGGEGHSTEKNLPLQWSESQNILWKTPVAGRGWSSPAVAGGRVWLTTSIDQSGTASLRLLAYDVESGRETINLEVFSVRNAVLKNIKNSLASPTPIVDGDRVYVHFGADGTAAVGTDGKILWKTVLPYDSMHGNGGSPTLYRDLLILSCDGSDEAYVVALDKNTGKIRWKTPRRQPYDQSYTTPLVIQVDGKDQVVSIGAFRAAAYDPLTGREIWRVRYGDGFSNVPRPVFGGGLVFIGTGFQEPSMLAVRPTGTGDVTNTHIAYTIERGAPFTPSPLIVGDEFYMVSDIGVASCLDVKTGRVHWQQRVPGNYSASPVFADGRIYFLSEEGVATVIAPGREFRRLAVNTLDGTTFASIAVSQGTLFIRSDTHLYRIGAK
jgi:outer membrane protein assembly factor BamB